MRSFFYGSLALGLVGASLLVGCGDDTGTGGSGGGGTGANGTGGTTNTGGGGTGGNAECVPVTVPDFGAQGQDLSGFFFYGGAPMPALGAAADDLVSLGLAPDTTGSIDLSTQTDATTCTACLFIGEDLDADGNPAKLYQARSGTLDLGTTTPWYIAGSLTNATFAEITIDDMGVVTVVPGGECVTIASIAIDVQPPVAGWTCDPTYYGDMQGCDCGCGAVDVDCADNAMMVYGCQDGQTCDANGECAGLPTGWTCNADQFDGGAGNGCDCACGAHDPDCDLMPAETLDGCAVGETVCTPTGYCLPTTWDCDPDYFADGLFCDCGCGVLDPDCADATKASCDICDDTGSCDTVACSDAASKINDTNNAVCN